MTRHLYRCPLRWADMDALGHVNNVRYVDYLQEARVDMLRVHPPAAGGERLAEGVVVVRHEVQYLRPLVFRRDPVLIEVWVTEVRAASFTLAYEVYDEPAPGERVVYLRARTLLTPYVFEHERPRRLSEQERALLAGFLDPAPAPLRSTVDLADVAGVRGEYPCPVRFSDVDAYRHVNNVVYFEYFQEARIALLTTLGSDTTYGPFSMLVAQVDVDYRRPLFFREQPYLVQTWVGRVGTSSFVVCGRIGDGETVLSASRTVLVAVDATTGRPAALRPEHRERLLGT